MTANMFETFLIPERTLIVANGDGYPVDITGAANRVFLLTMRITKIVEQESIDLAIFGSVDGQAWGAKALASVPQKFYCGEYPFLVSLTEMADVKFLRAHWEVNRWGRGPDAPMFEVGLKIREVPSEMLKEANALLQAR